MNIQELYEEAQKRQIEMLNKTAEYMEIRAANEVMASNEAHNKAAIEREAAELLKRQYRNCMRPSLTLRVEVAQKHGPNGEFWTATYGDCVGHGVTPETACQDFDRIWSGKDSDE